MATLSDIQKRRAGKGFSASPLTSYCLPREYYYSPEIYEREKQNIWYRNWIFVGLENDLQNIGDYITAMIGDQRIYVIRSKDGQLRSFYNVCQHRGHTLLEGKGNARLIACPYHAWVYDSFGMLRTAPQSKHVPGFSSEEFCIPEVRVETLGMMVFVNLDDKTESLADMGGRELLEQFKTAIPDFDSLQFVRREEFPLACNWKLVLDGLECYHCPYIHPEAMGPKSNLLQYSFEFTAARYSQQHISRTKGDLSQADPDTLPFKIGGSDIQDVHIWFLWPNLLFAARPGNSNIQILETVPLGAETCQHNLINFCKNNPATDADLSHMDFYRDVVFPQDSRAMIRQMEGMKTRGFVRGRLMVDPEHSWWSEAGTHHFNNLVWQALNGDDYEMR